MFLAMAIVNVQGNSPPEAKLRRELAYLDEIEAAGNYGQRIFTVDKKHHPGYRKLFQMDKLPQLSGDPTHIGYGTPAERLECLLGMVEAVTDTWVDFVNCANMIISYRNNGR